MVINKTSPDIDLMYILEWKQVPGGKYAMVFIPDLKISFPEEIDFIKEIYPNNPGQAKEYFRA